MDGQIQGQRAKRPKPSSRPLSPRFSVASDESLPLPSFLSASPGDKDRQFQRRLPNFLDDQLAAGLSKTTAENLLGSTFEEDDTDETQLHDPKPQGTEPFAPGNESPAHELAKYEFEGHEFGDDDSDAEHEADGSEMTAATCAPVPVPAPFLDADAAGEAMAYPDAVLPPPETLIPEFPESGATSSELVLVSHLRKLCELMGVRIVVIQEECEGLAFAFRKGARVELLWEAFRSASRPPSKRCVAMPNLALEAVAPSRMTDWFSQASILGEMHRTLSAIARLSTEPVWRIGRFEGMHFIPMAHIVNEDDGKNSATIHDLKRELISGGFTLRVMDMMIRKPVDPYGIDPSAIVGVVARMPHSQMQGALVATLMNQQFPASTIKDLEVSHFIACEWNGEGFQPVVPQNKEFQVFKLFFEDYVKSHQ